MLQEQALAFSRGGVMAHWSPMTSAFERFQTTLDLWGTAVAIKRQSLRRRHPELSGEQIDRLLNRWLAERPGAERGDGPQPTGD